MVQAQLAHQDFLHFLVRHVFLPVQGLCVRGPHGPHDI
jgi:hypothetical protein